MNYVFLRLCFWISFVSFSNCPPPQEQLDEQYIFKALVFSSSTRGIFRTRSFQQISAITYNRWVIACAAQSPGEVKITQNTSLEKKSLFVHNIAEDGFVSVGKTCKKPFQISVAYHSSEKELQFGYEVYYDTKKFGNLEWPSDKSIKSIRQYMSIIFALKTAIQQLQFNSLTLDDEEKTKLGFLWVTRISLQHNYKSYSPSIIRYKLLKNFPNMLRECDNYYLADEYFESIDVDSLYGNDNQKSILGEVDTSSFSSQFKCNPENERCLTKWQLIPPNQITFDSLAPSTCSNLTTVPIWIDLTQAPLQNLRIFLQAMIRIRKLQDNLDIAVIIGEPLALTKTGNKTANPIYLDSKSNKIPIPNRIYHFIKYKIPNCSAPQAICDHAIIIVIHNDPNNIDQNDQICSQKTDVCQKLGWNWIQYENIDTQSGQKLNYDNIYCCEPLAINPELLVKFETVSEDEIPKFNALDLCNFPFYDKTSGNMELKNLRDPILEQIAIMKNGNDDSGHGNSSFNRENNEPAEYDRQCRSEIAI